ncbi:MAG: excisionase [Gammaproteobacteria bacterium]
MNSESAKPVVITPARYVLLPVANVMTGYSVKAIQCKIHRGEGEQGKVWRRAPDGRIFVGIAAFERWVERR